MRGEVVKHLQRLTEIRRPHDAHRDSEWPICQTCIAIAVWDEVVLALNGWIADLAKKRSEDRSSRTALGRQMAELEAQLRGRS